jgi:hypothetical protein
MMFIFGTIRLLNNVNRGDFNMDNYRSLVNDYLEKGGTVTKVKPSTVRFKTFRGKAGAYNRGAKKITLRNQGFA